MSGYPLGLSRDERHVYRWLEAEGAEPLVLPSVTTIMGKAIAKPGIGYWQAYTAAHYLTSDMPMTNRLVAELGPEATATAASKRADALRHAKGDIGSAVHALFEGLLRGDTPAAVPDDLYGHWRGLQGFTEALKPRLMAAEEMVCSLKFGYAGTFDALLEIGGLVWLIDLKTGKPMAEHALQLAAYAYGRIARPGSTRLVSLPPIDRFGVLNVTADKWALMPYEVGRNELAAFLAALQLYRWLQGTKSGNGERAEI